MPPVADTLGSTTNRRLPLRMRPDLEVQRLQLQGREQVVVKDPLGLKYYRFEVEEYALLELLDGHASLEQLQDAFAARFPPQTINARELQRFLERLHRDALLISDRPGQGEQLQQRHGERARQQLHGLLSNLLCVRFRGFDPDRFLSWLSRWCGWCFSVPAGIAGLLLAVSALLLVSVEFTDFRARLPSLSAFAAPPNWPWLAAILAVTKLLHELGHGLACKRFGGECHEMGLLWMVVTPSLYCNVSDAWMVPNKWHRMVIGAAGVYVELILASGAAWLWWCTGTGWLNVLCLDVMLICSLSTLVINANPLLRYDGYYVLSDWLEIPNLHQRAAGVLQHLWATALLGLPVTMEPPLPLRRRLLLAAYAVLAAAYRWCVVLAVLWSLDRAFAPYRLRILGQLLALAAGYGLCILPLWRLGRFLFGVPGTWQRVKAARLAICGAALAILLLDMLLIPWPQRVTCPVRIQPREAAAVYVEVPGIIAEVHVQPGQAVTAGQRLVTLDNAEVHLAVERLQNDRDHLAAKVRTFRQRSLRGDAAAGQSLEPTQQALRAIEERLSQRRRDQDRLVLTANRDGVILVAPDRDAESETAERLPEWSGQPLDRRNVGAFLAEGVPLCRIGDPRQLEAVLTVEQSQVEFLQAGQQVAVILNQAPGQVLYTELEEVSATQRPPAAERMPARPESRPSPGANNATGRRESVAPVYQARCPLDGDSRQWVLDANGWAGVSVGRQTLGQRFWRFLHFPPSE